MANPEHLAILKQGVEVWNEWRGVHFSLRPDLTDADLREANLQGAYLLSSDLSRANMMGANLAGVDLSHSILREANLSKATVTGSLKKADLSGANLTETNMTGASLVEAVLDTETLREANLSYAILCGASLRNRDLHGVNLSEADLSEADFQGANLSGANLSGSHLLQANLCQADLSEANALKADLQEADLSHAKMRWVDLRQAILRDAQLNGAVLRQVDLSRATLDGADFSGTTFEKVIFALTDLSTAKGLDTIRHNGSSSLDVQTLRLSPNLPEVFLRGCGMPQPLIAYLPTFWEKANLYYSCIINFNPVDRPFAQRLYDSLSALGINCWLEERTTDPTDYIFPEIDREINHWDKVIICVSQSTEREGYWLMSYCDAIASGLYRRRGRYHVTRIPVDVDGDLLESHLNKPEWEKLNRNIPNFRGWEHDNTIFEREIERVIAALRTDEGRETPPTPKL